MKNKILTLCSLLSLASYSMGSKKAPTSGVFREINIPNAECGDGSPYKIFIRDGSSPKFLFHFQGGGACWDFATCYGPVPYSRLKEDVNLKDNTLDAHQPHHPLSDYTYVYLPYCTADIFAGTHIANYGPGHPKHLGRINTEKVMKWLLENTDLAKSQSTLVYGDSAGALGAILNLDLVDEATSKGSQKILLSDSPGLHFNANLWDRFSQPYMKDLQSAIQRVGLRIRKDSGDVAQDMPDYCHKFGGWRIGIIQGSQDIVMSAIFGNRTPLQHERAVFGPKGIVKAFENPKDECSSWTPHSANHVYMLSDFGRNIKSDDGLSARSYLDKILDTQSESFPSH